MDLATDMKMDLETATIQDTNMNILTLNVCGLKSKLQRPDFLEYISKFDILAFQETKLDDLDNIVIDGYSGYFKNRKRLARVRSGGIAIFIKNGLTKYCKLIDNPNKFAIWILISKQFIKSPKDVAFGCVYLPPEGTRYASIDYFNELEQSLIEFGAKNYNVCITGDLNARVGVLNDYVEDNVHINDPLNDTSLGEKRYSQDKETNTFGHRLIELCQATDCMIANGRVGTDAIAGGAKTCKGSSVVDYFLFTNDMLESMVDFEVEPFDMLFSDVHCKLVTKLKKRNVDVASHEGKQKHKKKKLPKIKSTNQPDFINNLDHHKIDFLKNFMNTLDNPSAADVDLIMTRIKDILNESAEKTCPRKQVNFVRKQTSKTWFGPECNNARKNYNKRRKQFLSNKTDANKDIMKQAGKDYKRIMNKHLKNHEKQFHLKLRNLKGNDPKSFWRTINSTNNQNTNNIDIDLQTMADHFKDLNTINQEEDYFDPIYVHDGEPYQRLNENITESDVSKALKSLKLNKSSGIDQIPNEFLRYSGPDMLGLYTNLFNIILDSGHIPEEWTIGIIRPIYKRKGVPTNPENYRGITLLSCVGKLFTSIINKRLNDYANDVSLISQSQAGFRPTFSTVDHIFSLKALIDLILAFNPLKKFYVAFVDYRKAFDSISHNRLFYKLAKSGIDGKVLNIIRKMYQNAKSCVGMNDETSDYFPCNVGVRQGENLSPLLFAIYLNDIESFFESKGCNHLEIFPEGIDPGNTINDLLVYLKLFLLLYADDTIIFSESPEGLQKALQCLEEYCQIWQLKVNTSKTKIMIFTKNNRRANVQPIFRFNGERIDIVDSYIYLGVEFSKNGKFYKERKRASNQAQKAMFALLKKCRTHNIPIDLQLQLFDTAVVPVLLYGSEVWGFEDNKIIESVHMKFLKYVLGVKKSTPNSIVYGELGRMPLELLIKQRMINYWAKIVSSHNAKINKILYSIMFELHQNNRFVWPWITYIKSTLENCGMGNIWYTQDFPDKNWLTRALKLRLTDQYKQSWLSELETSSSLQNYYLIKTEFGFENYLLTLPYKLSKNLRKMRTNNHKLPIETGRHDGTPRPDRRCNKCNSNEVGDEFHYVMKCDFFQDARNTYIPRKYHHRPNALRYRDLMTTNNKKLLLKLSKFISEIIATN